MAFRPDPIQPTSRFRPDPVQPVSGFRPDPGQAPKPDFKEVKKSLARGGLSVLSGVIRDVSRKLLKKRAAPVFSPYQVPSAFRAPGGEADKVAASLDKLSAAIHEEGRADDLQPDPSAGRVKKFFTQTLPEIVPYMISTTAATLAAGPTGGFLVGSAVEGNSHYRQAKDDMLAAGIPEKEAERKASNEGDIVGVVSGMIETAQISSAIKFAKGGAPQLIKQFVQAVKQKSLKKVTKVAGRLVVKDAELFAREALEEVSQEATSQGVGFVGHDGSFNLGQIGEAGLTGGTAALFLGGGGALAQAAITPGLPVDTTEAEPATPEVTPAEPAAEETAPDRPTPDQLHAGHKIPQFIGINAKKRKRIMKRLVGKDSMADMTQEEAQQVVDEFQEMAEEKGEDVSGLLIKPDFKEVAFGRLTPSEHRSRLMGVHFLVKPAIIGKRTQQVEVENISRQVHQMEQVINRMGGETFKSRTAAKLKGQPTASVERFFHLLDQNEIAPDTLTPDETKVFDFFRTLNTSLLARENEVRRDLGQDEIPNRKAYVRHVATQAASDMIDGRRRIPKDVEFLFKERVSKKIYNPMEFERRLTDELLNVFSRDLIKATDAMVWTATKEIHLNKPLRYFEEIMDLHRKDIPPSVRKWTERYVNETILGHQTETDEKWDKLVKEGGIGKAMDKALRPFGRTIGSRPFTTFMSKLSAGPIYGALGPLRPKQLVRNKFQFLQNFMLYKPAAMIKSFVVRNDQNLEELMDKSLFLKTYGGIEGASLTGGEAFKKIWLGAFKWSAVTNAKRAMRVAYFDTLDIITNKKFAKYGWADPQRSYTEKKGFLYESEKTLLLDEMEFGAGITQYHYMGLAMPEVFRSKVNAPFTRFQSWWMNYWFGFMREGATRAFTGKSATGRLIPPSRRFGLLRYLAVAGSALTFLGYSSSFLWGVVPGLAPMADLMLAMFDYSKGDERRKNMAWRRILNAMKTFIPGYLSFKDFKKAMSEDGEIEDLFFYEKGIFGDDSGNTGPQLNRRAK